MRALVIYDLTGKIWSIVYGETATPQGLNSMFVDIPDGAVLNHIDVTDAKNPVPVFNYLPESDIGRLQKKVSEIENTLYPSIDVNTCSLDELKKWQKDLVGKQCLTIIENGIDVEFADGNTYHFSYLANRDQINYIELKDQIRDGLTIVPYHGDDGDCMFFPADDIVKMITLQRANKTLNTTRCNGYNRMIDAAITKDEVVAVTWGSPLNEKYQAIYDQIETYVSELAKKFTEQPEPEVKEEETTPEVEETESTEPEVEEVVTPEEEEATEEVTE